MLAVTGLAFTHPGAVSGFHGVDFTVRSGRTVALIGDNGTGKTTLLRILAGELVADDGAVTVQGTCAYMDQEVGFGARAGATLRQLLASYAPAPLDRIAAAVEADERLLEAGEVEAGVRLADHYTRWGELGGYELEARWDAACRGVLGHGIDEVGDRTADQVSGGERKQLVLEVLLEGDAEVLLLDEPDNYLDVPAKLRLEERLRSSPKTILFISHDRDLLAGAPSRIVTLLPSGAWVHQGAYDTWPAADAARQEALGDELQRWNDEEQRLRDLVRILKERAKYADNFAPKARAAETRWKRFRDAGPPPPPDPEQRVTVTLSGRTAGRRLVRVERLGVDGLVAPFDLVLRAGDRIGVLGPNGTGKTHLLDELRRRCDTLDDTVVLAGDVRVGHFAQVTERADLLDRVPLDVVQERTGNRERAMSALARYGLASAGTQPYATLSGGQKARLEVLLLELAGTNLLLLDEPTDNLDLVSIEALEDALAGFRGALLTVTHDRGFLRSMRGFLHVGDDGLVHELADAGSAVTALAEGLAAVHGASRTLLGGA